MKSIIKVFLLLLGVVGASLCSVYGLKLLGISGGMLTKVIPFLYMGIGTSVFLKIIDNKEFHEIGLNSIKEAKISCIMMGMLAALPILVGCIINREIILIKPIDSTFLGIILYCLVVGFMEELIFRGYIYQTVSVERLRVAVSAVAFAGLHFISPEFGLVLFILYFLFGVLKCQMFKLTNSLWPLICFHTIWNLGTVYTDYYTNPIIDLSCLLFTLIVLRMVFIPVNKIYKIVLY